MTVAATDRTAMPAAIARLDALSPLDAAALRTLEQAIARSHVVPPRRELLSEGQPIRHPLLILDGWAARVQLLPDGRRQFVGFVLPGDVVGHAGYEDALAPCTVVALTRVAASSLLVADLSPALARATAIGRSLAEAHLTAQITRIGRMDARERIIDLVLELHERLTLAGLVRGDSFDLPLTQEMLADALGLTSVHVNRILQLIRRHGDLIWSDHRIRIPDIARLRHDVGRRVPRVAG